ncbi:hypothetical protein ABKN59_002007 [Abortiporus biennis]
MPAERTERRNSRKQTSEEDLELKRARGEISCAECRRLKLKCDKKLPCGSCVRRGCTTICPNGSLSSGQGTRFILADTDQLHRKISEMSERIRLLEDALAIFQAGVSSERHPLLRDELLSIKFGPEVRRTVDEEHSRNAASQSIDALGTLTVGTHGETKFIGRSGGSETLFMTDEFTANIEEDESSENDPENPELDQTFEDLSFTFPLTMVESGCDEIMDKLESHLPPQPRAWSLCEAYLEHFTWWFRPIKRDELIDDILIPIYKTVNDPNLKGYRAPFTLETRCPHLLAVLFSVLAIGALMDLTLPACSAEAEKYYRLARAAMSLRSIFDSPEIETVQGVALLAAYHSIATSRYSVESAWSMMSLAAKLAQGLGLHRDSSQWNLDPKVVQRRRNLFWELFIIETIHCMTLGRPPGVSRPFIDCELPPDEEKNLAECGDNNEGYWHWRVVFTSSVYANVVESLLTAKAPTYDVVLDLDRQIRQSKLPGIRLYLAPDEDGYSDPGRCMRSYLMSQYRSVMILGIHRTFFAQTLLDYPTNPLRSPYAPSFLAANRFWSIWTHAFTAAVILGSTVIRCPSATMAPSSLIELDLALGVFKRGASQSKRARKAVPILQTLKDKAQKAYQNFRNRHTGPASLDIQVPMGPEDDQVAQRKSGDDKLAIFGGQTRVMTSKVLSHKTRRLSKQSKARVETNGNGATNSTSSSPSVPVTNHAGEADPPSPVSSASTPSDTSVPQNMRDALKDVHPSLMEYLSLFPSSSLALIDPAQQPSLSSSPSIPPSSHASANQSPFNPASSSSLPTSPDYPMMPPTTTSSPSYGNPQQNGMASYYDIDNATMASAGQIPIQPQHLQDISSFFAMSGAGSAGPGGGMLPDVSTTLNMGNPTNPGFSDEVLMNNEWMYLMRDAGLFTQVPQNTTNGGQGGGAYPMM